MMKLELLEDKQAGEISQVDCGRGDGGGEGAELVHLPC